LKEISTVRDKQSEATVIGERQLGGTGTIPVQCPPWAILSLDHIGGLNNFAALVVLIPRP
jgi:hypothetical protein